MFGRASLQLFRRAFDRTANARVVYGLKRHWHDGTSAVSFDPLTFIERLAALVPHPRAH